MKRFFQVHQGKQLTHRNGEFICGGGERVAFDHPAVLALEEPERVGLFVHVDESAPTIAVGASDAPIEAGLLLPELQAKLAEPDDAAVEQPKRRFFGGSG